MTRKFAQMCLCAGAILLAGCQVCDCPDRALAEKLAWQLPGGTPLEMVYCPAGEFVMGSPEAEFERNSDEIQHKVTLTKPFLIGKYEVTQKQYERVIGSNPSVFKGEDRPVDSVTWFDAMAFCAKLNELTKDARPDGCVFRLPTEAEWEYACRAGTVTAWNSGKDIMHPERRDAELDEVAWNYYNSGWTTHPVGGKLPNRWGIFDMHGNVWEWCLDWMAPYAGDAVDPFPVHTPDQLKRVGRGGSWYYGSDRSRAGFREALCPSDQDCDIGFRVVLAPVVEERIAVVPQARIIQGVTEPEKSEIAVPESFSWGGVDGLGRVLPLAAEPVPAKKRTVAMFYWTWHDYHFQTSDGIPYVNTEWMAKYPEANANSAHPFWNGKPFDVAQYFWGKPLFGHYSNLDPWMLAKHAEMLADAGVDVIFFDATNVTLTWMPQTEALCEVFQKMRQQGIRAPQIAFMLNFAPNENTAVELRQLYRDFYSKGRYRELWFKWEGKPLIMAHPEALSRDNAADAEILDFFTFRHNEAGYITKDTPASATRWGWLSNYPQTRFGVTPGKPTACEEMVVSVAQNSAAHRLCAMNDPRGVFGRGFAKMGYEAKFPMADGKTMTVNMQTPEAWQWGLNLQQQFDYALQNDPEVIFVTGWNEWVASRFKNWQDTPSAFPDQFMPEFSRDIEPSAEAPYDNFYCQLAYNVRRYKGGSALPPPVTPGDETLMRDADAWRKVQPLFSDPRDCWARDCHGWKDCYYKSPLPPNDFLAAKASFDAENLYFFVECAQEIVRNTRLRLLLATGGAGWESFDFVIQRNAGGKFELMRLAPGSKFAPKRVAEVAVRVQGKTLAVAVPRKALNVPEKFTNPIQFKWSDEQDLEKSALAFYTDGDTAPNGRFRYVLVPKNIK